MYFFCFLWLFPFFCLLFLFFINSEISKKMFRNFQIVWFFKIQKFFDFFLALCWLVCTSNCLLSFTKLHVSLCVKFRPFSHGKTLNKVFRDVSHSLVINGNIEVIFSDILGLWGLNNGMMSPKISLINRADPFQFFLFLLFSFFLFYFPIFPFLENVHIFGKSSECLKMFNFFINFKEL